ncbi:MAG: hypothetical protein ACJ75I_08905 [Solirubrobacterales bacterium]
MRVRITIAAIGALTALALLAVPMAGAATDIHQATLKGSKAYPAVTGKAKFSRDDGVRQLEAQIENAKPLAGTTVRFRVNGVTVASAKVNALGTARIDVSGGPVPNVTQGSTIRVKRPNGVLVASGQFS